MGHRMREGTAKCALLAFKSDVSIAVRFKSDFIGSQPTTYLFIIKFKITKAPDFDCRWLGRPSSTGHC